MKTLFIILLGIFFNSQMLICQEVRQDNFIAFGANYGIEVPLADMADRFGTNFHAGFSIDFFKKKLNGVFTLEGSVLFGDNVKEDALSSLRTANGAILGSNGTYIDVFLRQKGTYVGVLFNKIVVPTKSNLHSGLSIGFGLGVLQHSLNIQVDSNNAPQFEGDYSKGYDRNTMGLALKQKIGYLHVGKKKSVNYEIALTIKEGFTKLTRSINFDTGQADDSSRLDMLIGLDFKWMIPISSQGKAEEEYFY